MNQIKVKPADAQVPQEQQIKQDASSLAPHQEDEETVKKNKSDWTRRLAPCWRYLIHLAHNPGNSEVHEKQKWLIACLFARNSYDQKVKVYERLNSTLDTTAVVTVFLAGFSIFIITDEIVMEEEKVPQQVVIGLLALSFVLSVCTTLVAVTIKTHIVEIGVEWLPTFFTKYSWTMSFLAHLTVNGVGTFMTSGILVVFNRFHVWIGSCMVVLVGILFAFLSILNLDLRDRSMIILGFDYLKGQYVLPDQLPMLSHADVGGDEILTASKGNTLQTSHSKSENPLPTADGSNERKIAFGDNPSSKDLRASASMYALNNVQCQYLSKEEVNKFFKSFEKH